MLTTESINAAIGIVVSAGKSDYALVPKPESALAKLVEATRVGDLVTYRDIDNVDPERLYRDLSFVANGIDPLHVTTTEHSSAMDGMITHLTNSMRSYLNYARNVATPAINEIVEAAINARESWNRPTTNASIAIWEPPRPLANDNFAKLIKPYGEEQLNEVRITKLINELANYAVIGDLIKTGVESLDADITIWYSSLDRYVVESLWNTFFAGLANGNIGNERVFTRDGNIWDYFRSNTVGHDCALFVYLLSKRLAEERHPDSAVGIEKFDIEIRRYLHASGQALFEQIRALNDSNVNGTLVKDIIKETETVVVFGPVYERWVDQNAETNDILLALTMKSIQKRYPYKTAFTVDEIAEMKPTLGGAWVSNMSVNEFAAKDHQVRLARNTLYDAFVAQMDRLSEVPGEGNNGEEETAEVYTGVRKVELINQWRDALWNEFSYEDIDRTQHWILKYMSKIRYHGRPVYELLSGIDMAIEGDSKLSSSEGAYMSALRYIVKWCVEQIMPTKNWNG